MSGLAWQKNSAADLSGAWSTIEAIEFASGDEITLGILESDGRARQGRLWVTGYELKSPGSTTNRNGAEVATEGWLEASADSGVTWQAFTFPTSFPAVFTDLGAAHGVLACSISASARTLIVFRFTIPAGASSAGVVRFRPVLRCIDA